MKLTRVSRRKVYLRCALSWVHTVVALSVTAIVMLGRALAMSRFVGPKVVFGIISTGVSITVLMYLFSPLVVQLVGRLGAVDESKYREFIGVFEELIEGRLVLFRPRLFITHISVPNAFAFGWGPFRGIAVSPELYDLLNREELKAVVAHEFAHLVSRDTGLMTVMAILTGGLEHFRKLLLNGKTVLGGGPFAWLFAGAIWLLSKAFFPLLRGIMQQEREFTADALSALYCGNAEPMISALQKLLSATPLRESDSGVLSDLYLSHPGTSERIRRLQSLAE